MVNYRVSWDEKDDTAITPDSFKSSLEKYLSTNYNYLDNYLVFANDISMKQVPDICSMKRNEELG